MTVNNANMATSFNPDPGVLFPCLDLGIYRLVFRIRGRNNLSGYLGSAWRGILGRELVRLFCMWPEEKDCHNCDMASSCLYYIMYERRGCISGFDMPPRPYILTPSGFSRNRIQVDITLAGLDDEQIIHVLSAMQNLTDIGTGRKKTFFDFETILQMQPGYKWTTVFPRNGAYRLHRLSWPLADFLDNAVFESPPWIVKLVTPLRLRKEHKVLRRIPWGWTFQRFARRLYLLTHQNSQEEPPPFPWHETDAFLENPGHIMDINYWKECQKVSFPQNRKIPTGGLQGGCVIIPPVGNEELWHRWWHSALLLHIGRKTTIGNGSIIFNDICGSMTKGRVSCLTNMEMN